MPIRSSRGNGSDVIPSTMAELAFFLVFVFAMAWMIEAATAPAQSADNVAEAPTPILVPVILPMSGPGPAPPPPPPPPQPVPPQPASPPAPPIMPVASNGSCFMEHNKFDHPPTDTTGRATIAAQQLGNISVGNLHGSFLEDEFTVWDPKRRQPGHIIDFEARGVIRIVLDWNNPSTIEIANNLFANTERYVAITNNGLIAAHDFLRDLGLAGNGNPSTLAKPDFDRRLNIASRHVKVGFGQTQICYLRRVIRIKNLPSTGSAEVKVDDFRDEAASLRQLNSSHYDQINDLILAIDNVLNPA